MNQAQIYMISGTCFGIAGLIVVILILDFVYGIRDSKRSTIQEAKK